MSDVDVVMSWLRLQNHLECITHPYHMYTKCLITLICCGPTSLSYVYKVFDHLDMPWMGGIWVCPYTVMPVEFGGIYWKIGMAELE